MDELEGEPKLNVDCLEMSIKSTVCEGEDGPDVKERISPYLECAKIP